MPQFNRQNLNFYYEVHGQGDPLILVAGFSCHCELWRPILDELKSHLQVIIYDNRGIGRSSIPKDHYTIDEMAEDLLALIQHLKLEEVSLLGHSMGGAIVQMMAYKHPKYVKQMVLSNTSAKFRACATMAEQFILVLREQAIPVASQAQYLLPWLYSDHFLDNLKHRQAFIEAAVQDPYPFSIEGYKGQLNALLTFDSRTWLPQLKIPTLLLSGGEDRLCLKDALELKQLLPQAQEFYFPNCGHLPFYEEPEVFLKQVVQFLTTK